jgi:hypothetical protein
MHKQRKVRTATFNDVIFDIDIGEDDELLEGYCDDPIHHSRPTLRATINARCSGLENVIHEALHASNWLVDEENVTRTAKEIARLLWRFDYRRLT